MAIRKQLQWNESTDIWPITDASAVHYTYNPSDATKITNPVSGTSYGLDKFLNGLGDIFMSKDEVTGLAVNISKGVGVLYNSAANTTAVAAPAVNGTSNFVKCTYTSAGAFSISFDTTTYLPSTTAYAEGDSNKYAKKALDIVGGAKGNLLYQNAANDTAFLANGSSGQFLGWGSSGIPVWTTVENYTTTPIASATYGLSKSTWTPVPTISFTQTGTYALYIDDSTNGSYAGIFAVEGGAKEKLEEIPLHWATTATTTADTKRIYAAINQGKLQLASTDASATNYTLTIKYKRII